MNDFYEQETQTCFRLRYSDYKIVKKRKLKQIK